MESATLQRYSTIVHQNMQLRQVDDKSCTFAECDRPSVCRLTACWQDGLIWHRNVCRLHLARGIRSLEKLRGLESSKPTITIGTHGLVINAATGRRNVHAA
jgi:hypothetical protein